MIALSHDSGPAVGVVVLNWRRPHETIQCLDSLLALDWPSLDVVIVDNDSGDDSIPIIEQWMRRNAEAMDAIQTSHGIALSFQASRGGAAKRLGFHLIRSASNLGYAGGNNLGLSFSFDRLNVSYVWILNNDTEVSRDSLRPLVAKMESDTHLGMCGSTLLYEADRNMVQALGGATYSRWTGRAKHLGAFRQFAPDQLSAGDVEPKMDYISGAAVMISQQFYRVVGPMDERFFLYYEEIDWALRNKRRFRLGWAPTSVVFHKEGATIGTQPGGGSELSLFYMYRNRLRVCWIHHPLTLPSVVATVVMDLIKLLVRSDMRRTKAALRGAWAFFSG